MIDLAKNCFREYGYDEEEATHVRLKLPASLCIFVNLSPTQTIITQHNAIFPPKDFLRIVNEKVSIVGDHTSDKVGMDNIMV